MKVEIERREPHKSRKYPYVGERKEQDGVITIVLFTNPYVGMSLYSSLDLPLDFHNWAEEDFTPINGKLIISND